MTAGRASGSRRWLWIAIIVALAFVNFVVWADRVGQCVDYAADSGSASTCTSTPVAGYAGAGVISFLSVLVVIWCGFRLARTVRSLGDVDTGERG